MNQVRIKSMSLHYFKGVRNQEITFSDCETIISGPNGCGKSTIADAFYWCLWGKNAAGQTAFGIKTVEENGTEIPHVDHEVSVELDVNGERQTFTRNLQPKYNSDDSLKGNEVAYSWNNMPIKKSEYDKKVAAVISEDVFRLITSTTAFMAKKAEERRAILLKMAGDVTDRDVAERLDSGYDGEFNAMLDQLSGTTIEQQRKAIDAQIRTINEAMQTIPARIDEVKRSMPEQPDTEALTQERQDIQQQIATIEQSAADTAKAIEMRNADRNNLLQQVDDLLRKQMDILNKAQSEERMAIHKANQVCTQAEADIKAIEGEERADHQQTNTAINQINATIANNSKAADAIEQQLAKMRQEWTDINQQQFTASEFLTCPLFGHTCTDCTAAQRYDNNQQHAFETFEQQKQQRLSDITTQGKQMSAQLQQLIDNSSKNSSELEELKKAYQSRTESRQQRTISLQNVMTANPKRPLIATIQGKDIPEWCDMQQQIEDLRAKINETTYEQPDNSWQMQTASLNQRLRQIEVEMARETQRNLAELRIEVLEKELRDEGILKSELEYRRSLLTKFEQARMDMVSESINGMFHLARWQMWTMQVNGEKKDDCVCLCNGVRFEDANTATRINTGIDIAYTIAQHLAKCTAPMFIDNGESITDIYNPGMQQIILRVDGKKKKMSIDWK